MQRLDELAETGHRAIGGCLVREYRFHRRHGRVVQHVEKW